MITDLLLDEPLPSSEDLPVPQAPRPPILQPVADRLTAVWSLPVRNPAVTHFALIIRQVGTNDWFAIDSQTLTPTKDNAAAFPSLQTSCYMEGLISNKQFQACLAVKNPYGWSAYSEPSLVVFFPRFLRHVISSAKSAPRPASQASSQSQASGAASGAALAASAESSVFRVFLCIFKNGVMFRRTPSFEDKTDSGVFGGETVRVRGLVNKKEWLHCDNGLYLPLRLSVSQPLFEEVDAGVHTQSKPLFVDGDQILRFSVDAVVEPLKSAPLKSSPNRKILAPPNKAAAGTGLTHAEKLLVIYEAKKQQQREADTMKRVMNARRDEDDEDEDEAATVQGQSERDSPGAGPAQAPQLPPIPSVVSGLGEEPRLASASARTPPRKSISIALVRVAVTERWGFMWGADGWGEGNRKVARIERDSPVYFWNSEHPAEAIQPGDELVAVNGNLKDVHATLRAAGMSVDLVFMRASHQIPADATRCVPGEETKKPTGKKGQLRVTLDWTFSPPRVLEVSNGEDWGLGMGDRIISVNGEDVTRVADPADRLRILEAVENWRPLKMKIIKRKVLEEKGLKALIALEGLQSGSDSRKIQRFTVSSAPEQVGRHWGVYWDVGALRAHGLRIVESVDPDSELFGKLGLGSRLVSVNSQEDPSDVAAELRRVAAAELRSSSGPGVDLVFARPCTGEVVVVPLHRFSREPWGVLTKRVPGSLALEVGEIVKDSAADRTEGGLRVPLRVGDQIVTVNESFRCEDMMRLLDDQEKEEVVVKVTREGAFRTRQHLTGSYNDNTTVLAASVDAAETEEAEAEAETETDMQLAGADTQGRGDVGEYCQLPWCLSLGVKRQSLAEEWGWDPALSGRVITEQTQPPRNSPFARLLFLEDKVLSVNGKEKKAEMADELSRSVYAEVKVYRHKAMVRSWEIRLQTLTGRFGFVLDEDRRIRELQDEQPLWSFNIKFPHVAVKLGDTVLSVNGLSSLYDMRTEMDTKLEVAITVARCIDQAVKLKEIPKPIQVVVNHVPDIPDITNTEDQLPDHQPQSPQHSPLARADSDDGSSCESGQATRERFFVAHPAIAPAVPPSAAVWNSSRFPQAEHEQEAEDGKTSRDLSEKLIDPSHNWVAASSAVDYLGFLYERPTRFVTLIREDSSQRWGLSLEVQTGRVVGIQPGSVADKHGGVKKFDRLMELPKPINLLRDPYLLEVRMLVTTDFKRPEGVTGNVVEEGGRRVFEVELSRIADESWGFAWNKEIFGTQGKRVIEAIIANTPAWRANDQCTDQARVLVAGDELIDVNRKQGFEAIGVEVANAKRITCVFARELQPHTETNNMCMCCVERRSSGSS